MYELNHKEGRVLKNWWFWIVLDKTLESPLDNKENRPVSPKVNQLWIFIERTDAEVEAPILWPPDEEVDLLEKTLMLGKIEGKRRRERQSMRWLDSITDSMDRNVSKLWDIVKDGEAWHAVYSPWGRKKPNTTYQLNNNNKFHQLEITIDSNF